MRRGVSMAWKITSIAVVAVSLYALSERAKKAAKLSWILFLIEYAFWIFRI